MQTEVQTTAQTAIEELLVQAEDELVKACQGPGASQEYIREILAARRRIIAALEA